MSLAQDFKAFALKGNVLDLAVAVVIGGAFGKIVSALVADLIMPIMGALTPSGDWRTFTVTPLKLNVGHLIGEIVDFTIIAFVLFLVVVKLMGVLRKKEATPTTKTCPECLEAIPLQARRCRACTAVVGAAVLLWALLAAPAAYAQKEAKFEFGKAEEVKQVEWKAQAKTGLIVTSGNSRTTTFTLGLSASRKEAGNKFALDAGAAYARSSILVFQDTNGNGAIDRGELRRQDQTTANSWFTKARYDRFLSEHNSAYLSALASADQPAGKDFVGGGQIGYSRQLFKTDQHELVAELGYDLSYESYLTPVDSSVTIHSARIFVGHTSKLTDATSAFANVEALLNLNSESTLNADDDTGMTKTVDPLSDTRVNIKAGLTTTLWKNISFSFGFTLKYDHNPAPLPAPKGAPAYAAGFQPFADTVDTITEAALIVNFL